jgi:hypothetical protein
MIEPTVKLPIEQWQQVLAILAQAPWAQANPLIMGIGEQLRAQSPRPNGEDATVVRQ